MFCVPNPPLTSLTSCSANEPSGRQYCDITVHWPMAVFLGRALLGPPPSIDKEKPSSPAEPLNPQDSRWSMTPS